MSRRFPRKSNVSPPTLTPIQGSSPDTNNECTRVEPSNHWSLYSSFILAVLSSAKTSVLNFIVYVVYYISDVCVHACMDIRVCFFISNSKGLLYEDCFKVTALQCFKTPTSAVAAVNHHHHGKHGCQCMHKNEIARTF